MFSKNIFYFKNIKYKIFFFYCQIYFLIFFILKNKKML